ncbi:hypothetical protein OZZ95_01915 [Enterococcus sp. E5-103]|uniref:hypothetical protein n=1 Tax=Enterococcus TaxID=1350 RepID=UPI000A34F9E8|nr:MULTISPECIES: hypothetical protein [Enterococcus]MCD5100719.1 hypothetical protein [Enterococcus faecalis]MEB4770811.1 hypothetical protein [Enterococcus sp. E5-103]NSO63371.1 hypothetical protein [Enterococcus faecalis]
MHELIKEIERQLEMDRVEEGNMSAEDVLYIVKGFKKPYLNENQQIVLDWLKERFNETEIKASCTGYLWKLHQSYIDDEADEAGIAYEELSYEEESEMVRVFAEWFEQERK